MIKPRWWVVCPDFVSGPHGSEEVAQRHVQHVDELGSCHWPHEVVKSAAKPVAANHSLAWKTDTDWETS